MGLPSCCEGEQDHDCQAAENESKVSKAECDSHAQVSETIPDQARVTSDLS